MTSAGLRSNHDPRPEQYLVSFPVGRIHTIRIFGQLKKAVPGLGSETQYERDALDQPNLHKKIVDGIIRLKRRGPRGAETLPSVVAVVIEVGEGSVGVVQSFVNDEEFDREVGRDLLNRLVKIEADRLPARLYEVRSAARTRVIVEETSEGNLAWLAIEGGDRHDSWYPIAISQAEWRMGRGIWHGEQETVRNDIVVSDSALFVSRGAAVLRRMGAGLAIESLGQGDYLVVTKGSQRMRPTHVRGDSVRVGPGDVIEFNDGKSQTIKVRVYSRLPATPGSKNDRV